MGAPVVQVEGLTFRYPASDQVMRDSNLEINRGDFVGITGPSGAGKTTLCMCLKGLIPHVVGGTMRGRVIVREMDTRKTEPSILAEAFALIFQGPETSIPGPPVG